jgi:hypothetical protein
MQNANVDYSAPVSSIDELMLLHGPRFVTAAYLALLKRQPDPEGLSFYSMRLLTGSPKMQVIHEISSSDEAKAKQSRLPGLDRALRVYKWSRSPWLGIVVRFFYHVELNTAKQRRLRVIEQFVSDLDDRTGEYMQSLSVQLATVIQALAKQDDKVSQIAQYMSSAVTISPKIEAQELQRLPECFDSLSPRGRAVYAHLVSASKRARTTG